MTFFSAVRRAGACGLLIIAATLAAGEKKAEPDRQIEKWLGDPAEFDAVIASAGADEARRVSLERIRTARERGVTARLYADHPEIIDELLDAADWHARKDAVFAIRTLKTRNAAYPEGLDVLLGLLNDPEAGVRRNVVDALGLYPDPGAAEALAGVVRNGNEKDFIVRYGALRSLGKIGATGTANCVKEIALKDPSWEMRMEAVCVLERLEGVDSLDVLSAAARDRHDRVRSEAVRVLGRIGGARTGPALIAAIDDIHPQVRLFAVRGVSRLPSLANMRHAARLLSDPSTDVRSEACVSIMDQVKSLRMDPGRADPKALDREIGGEIVPALAARLEAETDHKALTVTVRVLARVGERLAIDALIKAIPLVRMTADPQYRPFVRNEILKSLADLGDPRAIPAIVRSLGTDDPDTHEASRAPETLSLLAGEPLETVEECRRWWEEALLAIRSPKILPAEESERLVAELGNSDLSRRQTARNRLRAAGLDIKDRLIRAAADQDAETARAATELVDRLKVLAAIAGQLERERQE